MAHKKRLQQFKIEDEFLENYESLETRKTYTQAINYFLKFIITFYPKALDITDIERKMIIHYRNHIKEFTGPDGNLMAPNTVSLRLAAISSYFVYLIEKGVLRHNPSSSIRRPKKEVISPTQALSKEQVRELFNSIESKESGPLHLALISTLWLTGLRKAEILNLKRKDYYEINDHKVLRFVAKGGKHRQKMVHSELEIILEDYFKWMKSKGRELVLEDWLFQPTKNPMAPTNVGKQLNPRTLNRIIEKYSRKIGVNFNVSPHSARATFISTLLETGVPIVDVAKEVTHSSIKTTQIYDKRRINVTKSPVNKLSY